MSREHDTTGLDLAPFERALVAEFARELDGDVPAPDVVAVFCRARELEPDRVPEELLREAKELEPVVCLRARARARRQDKQTLDLLPFVRDYRTELDEELRSERLPPVVPLDGDRRTRRSRSKIGIGIGVGLSVAASIALFFSLLHGTEPDALGRDASSQAERTLSGRSAGGQASAKGAASSGTVRVHDRHQGSPQTRTHDSADKATGDQLGASTNKFADGVPVDEGVVDEGADGELTTSETAAFGGAAQVGTKQLREQLRRLDKQARARWSAGKLRAAERSFRELVDIGGRHRLVELAYGDLFTLARQLHGEHAQPRLWREYLARFPRGRFADGARAGLCTRIRGGAQRRCWQRYLRYFPSGAHSKDARRRLEAAEEDGR